LKNCRYAGQNHPPSRYAQGFVVCDGPHRFASAILPKTPPIDIFLWDTGRRMAGERIGCVMN